MTSAETQLNKESNEWLLLSWSFTLTAWSSSR